MLYLDVALPIKTFKPKPGRPNCGVVLGRRQRRRSYESTLGLPQSYSDQARLDPRLYRNLTIVRSDNGHLCIEQRRDSKIFLILTSHLTDDRDFIGNIRIPRRQHTKIIGRALAVPGTGRWETLIIEATKGESFYVNWNTPEGANGVNGFYHVGIDTVYSCMRSGIAGLFRDINVKPRFTVREDSDRSSSLNMSEWRKL